MKTNNNNNKVSNKDNDLDRDKLSEVRIELHKELGLKVKKDLKTYSQGELLLYISLLKKMKLGGKGLENFRRAKKQELVIINNYYGLTKENILEMEEPKVANLLNEFYNNKEHQFKVLIDPEVAKIRDTYKKLSNKELDIIEGENNKKKLEHQKKKEKLTKQLSKIELSLDKFKNFNPTMEKYNRKKFELQGEIRQLEYDKNKTPEDEKRLKKLKIQLEQTDKRLKISKDKKEKLQKIKNIKQKANEKLNNENKEIREIDLQNKRIDGSREDRVFRQSRRDVITAKATQLNKIINKSGNIQRRKNKYATNDIETLRKNILYTYTKEEINNLDKTLDQEIRETQREREELLRNAKSKLGNVKKLYEKLKGPIMEATRTLKEGIVSEIESPTRGIE